MAWTKKELALFKSFNSPDDIQDYIDDLDYHKKDVVYSPRVIMEKRQAHCLEGALFAATALEFLGFSPRLINLLAHDDDHHAIIVYKTSSGWGSIAKSDTTMLRGRLPFFKSIRELSMSYFNFYFNYKRRYSMYGYSRPIDLNSYNDLNWRESLDNLYEFGVELTEGHHHYILSKDHLKKLPKVVPTIKRACFMKSPN